MCKRPIKHGQGRQFAALPFRQEGGETRILLITSRETGRWVLPKGWAEKKLSGPELAAKEAFEEAGLHGEIATRRIGSYSYDKRLPNRKTVNCRVDVFPLHVQDMLDDWPERGQRVRQWFSLAQAAMQVEENELVVLLLQLALSGIAPARRHSDRIRYLGEGTVPVRPDEPAKVDVPPAPGVMTPLPPPGVVIV